MKTTYLDFYKMVLQKVSFDKHLLSKEFKKAARDLSDHEKTELMLWLEEAGLMSFVVVESKV
nr:hypothetical protein [Cytophagales bacterium]